MDWDAGGAGVLKHEHLPAGVDEGAAEEEAVHRLVHQPIEHHLAVPRADRHPQLEVAALARVVVADGEQAHHLHVKGDGGANGDGGQLVGHLFPVDENGTWGEEVWENSTFVIYHKKESKLNFS